MRITACLFAVIAIAALVYIYVSADSQERNALPAINKHDAEVKGMLDKVLRKIDDVKIITLLDEIQGKLSALERTVVLLTCANQRFLDRGLTVYDCQTGLEWEKKTDDNVSATYTWSTCSGVDPQYPALGECPPDGPVFDYVAQLNSEPCFAGKCDWRIPEFNNVFTTSFWEGTRLDGSTPADTPELETIRDFTKGRCADPSVDLPCIDPIFGPTALSEYWTSITVDYADFTSANTVYFDRISDASGRIKTTNASVRAVRTDP